MRVLISILVFSSFSIAFASPLEYLWQTRNEKKLAELQKRQLTPFKRLAIEERTATRWFTQKLDHNNVKDERTFQQRYWVNSVYANKKNSSAPVLLYICGEGACGSHSVTGMAAIHASKMGAHVVGLEHRYYGESQPFTDLKTENLKYLTVDFALKDLLAIKKHLQNTEGLGQKWILLGGSYAGALAAYGRALYPDDFAGALASSGPVRADLDFSEYDRHVALMAGPTCLAAVQKTVEEIEALVMSEKTFESIKSEFNATVLKNKQDFLYLIADTAAAAVQYGMREAFCTYVEEGGRAGYAKAAEMVSGLFGNLTELSAQAAEDTSLTQNKGGIGMRQWFYQSCTEFGFWQNAWSDSKLSSRSKQINAQYHADICKRLFNQDVDANVDKTNADYLNPILSTSISRILFTNGSEDPWINLSLVEEDKKPGNLNLEMFVIEGGAHCDDLSSNNSEEAKKARALFVELAQDWILK